MENSTSTNFELFKSDMEKEGRKENWFSHNLTCSNYVVQELQSSMNDGLRKFSLLKQEGESGKELLIGIKNDEITGKNNIVRINLGTDPQQLESWDIKEEVNTLSTAYFLKQFDDFKIEQQKIMENTPSANDDFTAGREENVVFKSDTEKGEHGSLMNNLTCLDYEKHELKTDELDELNKLRLITQWKGTEKEVFLGIKNDDVTGENTLIRINVNTDPQTVESFDIKEEVNSLSAALFLKQFDDFKLEQEKNQKHENENKNLGETRPIETGSKENSETNDLKITKDKIVPAYTNNIARIKEKIMKNDPAEIIDLEEFKHEGKTYSMVNHKVPRTGKDEHFLQIADKNEIRYIHFNNKVSFEEAIKKIYQNDEKKLDSFLNKYDGYTKKAEKGTIKNPFEKAVDYLHKKAGLIAGQIALAKKMGYVQGVCECVAAIGDDHTLGKKLLSEMNVTKDMAKKFANPETFKALEQGIFAPQQKIEQTHSMKW